MVSGIERSLKGDKAWVLLGGGQRVYKWDPERNPMFETSQKI